MDGVHRSLDGMDVLEVIRLDDATLATYMRELCRVAIQAGFHDWPRGAWWRVLAAEDEVPASAAPQEDVAPGEETAPITSQQFRVVRDAAGMTQGQFAAALTSHLRRVSAQMVSDWERGVTPIPDDIQAQVLAIRGRGQEDTHG